MLDLDQLDIRRVIVHHLPKRAVGVKQIVEPIVEHALYDLQPAGKDVFGQRIAEALGHKSHGIQADFVRVDKGDFFQAAAAAMRADDDGFIEATQLIVQQLAIAQGLKDLAASKLLIVSGVVTALERPFISVIKAEMQNAFGERKEEDKIVIDYIKDVFLTESQRLYKIGFVQQTVAKSDPVDGLYNKADFRVHLFDHLLTGTETRSAAFYFYNEFMGADIAASDKRLTQEFYEKTLKFLSSSGLSPADRLDKVESLRSDLRSNVQTLSVSEFAKTHLSPELGKQYAAYMAKTGFPTHAVTKNTEYVKSKLRRRRKVIFDSGVMITTPADGMDLITLNAEAKDGTVTVIVKGKVESQE